MEKKKYGPKVGAKNRDVTSKRHISRKATFGTPTGRPSLLRASSGYVAKNSAKSFRPTITNIYKSPVTSATVRPNSTGYIKKTYTPRTPETGGDERKPFVRSSYGIGGRPESRTPYTKAGYVKSSTHSAFPVKKSTSWSKSKMEKGKYAEKRTPYVPRSGVPTAYSPRPGTGRSEDFAGKKAYTKHGDKEGVKPSFRSNIPNRPRTASASWGEVASWYDKHLNEADTYHEKVILPNLIRLIDAKADDNILDLACGQGFFTRAIAKTGAKVEGVDIAPELIAIAKAESPLIPYHVASADKLTMFDNDTFTKALISLSIQNIEHIESTMKEAARVLTQGGQLHIVMNHPAFRIPKASSWDYDDQNKVQFRRIDQYLSNSSTAIDMHPGFADSPQTISFHRPLQFYFKAFTKAGFAVTKLEEWISHKASDSGPRAKAENDARKEIP
ncbi:MAG: hypothetical protein A2845_01210, partial [Candidatus Lloydbacteria bacterium RIFCSPHIGHO2_01_FULL_49_22]